MENRFLEPIMALYRTLPLEPPAQQYTVMAAFLLAPLFEGSCKVVSLATGTKCLPSTKLPADGSACHDSHAEVLARRGALRWFLEEIGRDIANSHSQWIYCCDDGKYALKTGIQLVLYVSTVPCGDASMRFLASYQDEEMAALKDASVHPPINPNSAARGRDNYSLWGVLRTKPGRADSPPTSCMSCSDKIAAWNFLGIQGALGSRFLRPLYIQDVIIGEVPGALHNTVREDCERALWGRLDGIADWGAYYALHKPTIHFTSVPFVHSRTSVASVASQVNGSCNDSLYWIADSLKPAEVIINGYKRGVAPKHRNREKFRPRACQKSVLQLYLETLRVCGLPPESNSSTYHDVKQSMPEYQAAKETLMGKAGRFCGWIRGPSTQRFLMRSNETFVVASSLKKIQH